MPRNASVTTVSATLINIFIGTSWQGWRMCL